MPEFLENKLKNEYGQDSSIPYKVMNSIGAMRGSRETAKGRAMERKHNSDSIPKRMASGGVIPMFGGGVVNAAPPFEAVI